MGLPSHRFHLFSLPDSLLMFVSFPTHILKKRLVKFTEQVHEAGVACWFQLLADWVLCLPFVLRQYYSLEAILQQHLEALRKDLAMI